MKKTAVLGLIFLTLALVGCDNQSSSPVPEKNGLYYWANTGSGRYALLGIAEPSSFEDGKAVISPKSGYWYAVWLVTVNDLYSNPVSMGTISVNGKNLSFSPFPDMGFSTGVFTGTLENGILNMDSLPGISTGALSLEEGSGFNFDFDDPGGTFPIPPDDGEDMGGGGSSAQSSMPFKAGRYVTDVVFIDRPSVKSAYEGYPVNLTGMKVEIRYNTGEKETKTASNAAEFLVEPPVYEASNGIHTIRYIAEYNNPSILVSNGMNREFRAPFTDPASDTSFYEILNPNAELEATVSGNKEYLESGLFFDFSGINIKASYSTGDRVIVPSSVYKINFTPGITSDESEVRIMVGRKYANVLIDNKRVYPILKVEIEKTASFSDQVLFDDPRFYSGNAEAHWLSRLKDSSFRVVFSGTTVSKSISAMDAIAKWRFDINTPPNLTNNPKLSYTFYGEDGRIINEPSQAVPVFSRLNGITIEPLKGDIVLKGNGPLPRDDEQSFLRQVKISAVYQLGSNRNSTVKRDNILVYANPAAFIFSTGVDTELINASPLVTNVHGNPGGILTTSNSNLFNTKGRLSKASVSFTTTSVGDVNNSSSKSATIEVGVTGY